MAILLSCHNVSKSFSTHPLFKQIAFGVEERDRVGIVGPNGAGKSTFLKILAGEIQPDEGVVTLKKGTKLVYVGQQALFPPNLTVEGAVFAAFAALGKDPHEHQAQVNKILGKVGFTDPDQNVDQLSGGWRKRLSIACALAQEPEILLLDEPTNHLDLTGILWLENLLRGAQFACMVISHDRYFLENTTNKTVELNHLYPTGLWEFSGAYSAFLLAKSDYLSGQQQAQASLANKVRREVEWLRQGAKARTTKQQARIQAAGDLQKELGNLSQRLKQGTVGVDFTASDRKTKKLVKLVDASKSLGGKRLLHKLELTLSAGDRLGLLGANGSGKTTLLQLLAGRVALDSGTVEVADKLQIVYFQQNRERLDLNATLKRNLAPDGDSVIYRGRSVHVASWVKRFLFKTEQLEVPVGKLSGGEQARVLIAKLMLEPADVLLLDEPTNDLDIPTLEVLEESLLEFPGAVVLVTHDRYMLDRISTRLLALDGTGGIEAFADVSQWLSAEVEKERKNRPVLERSSAQVVVPKKTKLSFNEQRELDGMEAALAEAEAIHARCLNDIGDPAVVANATLAQAAYTALNAAQETIDHLYARWEALEKKRHG